MKGRIKNLGKGNNKLQEPEEGATLKNGHAANARAVNIELGFSVSNSNRYWEGRSDALNEFRYWYEHGGKDSGSKNIEKYLNNMSGTKSEKGRAVELGFWHAADRSKPKDGKRVLMQVYSLYENRVILTCGARRDGAWEADTIESAIADDDARPYFIVQAWMELPKEYVKPEEE